MKGRLDKKWTEWFDGMTIIYEKEDTVLTGQVADQTALHGLLDRIRDINLTLLLVERFESHRAKNISAYCVTN